MRIVHVLQYFQPVLGYQETYLARLQGEQGHVVTVIACDHHYPFPNYTQTHEPVLGPRFIGAGRRDEEGIDTLRLKSIELGNHPVLLGLARTLDALDPDVVHLHGTGTPLSFQVYLHKNKGARYRLVVDEHNTSPTMNQTLAHHVYRWLVRTFLSPVINRAAHAVIGINNHSCTIARRMYGVKPEKIGFLPNAADRHLFTRRPEAADEIRTYLGIGADADVLLYSGKVMPYKKVDVLVDALPTVRETRPDTHLVILGNLDRDYSDALKRRAVELGVGGRVHVHSAVPTRELPGWLTMATLACWPNDRTITMIEAASCELPILVSGVAGVNYHVSGDNGEFIEDHGLNPANVGGQIARILSDRERLAEMGKNGRKLVEEKLCWEAVNGGYMDLYQGGDPGNYALPPA